jgi:hypothetical protein
MEPLKALEKRASRCHCRSPYQLSICRALNWNQTAVLKPPKAPLRSLTSWKASAGAAAVTALPVVLVSSVVLALAHSVAGMGSSIAAWMRVQDHPCDPSVLT